LLVVAELDLELQLLFRDRLSADRTCGSDARTRALRGAAGELSLRDGFSGLFAEAGFARHDWALS
jgi:hypothetical protein